MTARATDVWLDTELEPLRVLVADEDPIVRRLVASVLSELGHDVRASSTGREAWRTFEEWQPELVVLDVSLDDVDGLEVCRRIRDWDEKREVFVLFLVERDNAEILVFLQRPIERIVHALSQRNLLNQRAIRELQQQGDPLESVCEHPHMGPAALGNRETSRENAIGFVRVRFDDVDPIALVGRSADRHVEDPGSD